MRGLIATVLILGLTGCVRFMGDEGDEPLDGAVDPPDLARDQALTDHPLAPTDGPPTKLDAAVTNPDGPVPKPDAVQPTPDAAVTNPDAAQPKPDAPQPDGPLPQYDGPLPKPDVGSAVCAPNTFSVSVGSKAVLCSSKTLLYDQCGAHNLCSKKAAHLCSASEYQNRVKSGISTAAWIAGCTRMGGTPIVPTNTICSVCTSFAAANEVVEWLCPPSSIGAKSTYSHLGLATFTDCRRVGVDQAATEGFWRTSHSGSKLAAAVCCY